MSIWVQWLVFVLPLGAAEPQPGSCEGLWAELSVAEIQEVKGLLSHRVSQADNEVFSQALFANSDDPLIYFHVENAVLKALNDIYFRDKELSAGITSWYKRNLMEIMSQFVSQEPQLIYADYKGIRLGFENPSELLLHQLSALHHAAGVQFAGQLERYSELGVLFSADHGLVSNPRAWFLAGIGTTPDRAAVAARVARYHSDSKGEVPPILDFSDPKIRGELAQRLLQAESRRTLLEEYFEAQQKPDFPLVTKGDGHAAVPTTFLLDTLRKIEARTKKGYLAEVGGRVERRFEVELTNAEIEILQRYNHAVETFSPSVLERDEIVDMGMGRGSHGMVTVDINGQGNRNMFRTQVALSETSATRVQPVEASLFQARLEQNRASQEFEVRREAVGRVFGEVFPSWEQRVSFSGDDGLYLPPRNLTLDQKKAVMHGLGDLGEPGSYRVSFVPQAYADTQRVIPSGTASQFVTLSENYEKAVRKALERSGYSYWRLRSIIMGVDLAPSEKGPHRIRLLVDGPIDEASRKLIEKVAAAEVPAGAKLESVD